MSNFKSERHYSLGTDANVRIKHIAPSRVQRRKPVRWGQLFWHACMLVSMSWVLALLCHAIVSNS